MNRKKTRSLGLVRVLQNPRPNVILSFLMPCRRPNVVLPFLMPFLVGGAWGCEHQPEGWTPVLEETSTAFLESEVDRMSERVGVALEHLTGDPDQTEAALQETAASLEHLRDYYLPLFQARERAYNAYRSLYLDDRGRVMVELERIEGILGAMAERAQGGRLQEIQELAEALADARMAVESGPEEGARGLETLARVLNQAALKGDMILVR